MTWMIGILIASNIIWIVLVLLQNDSWFKESMHQNDIWYEHCQEMNQRWTEYIMTQLNRLEFEIEKLRGSNQEEGEQE